ncbi:MAG: bifunctional UDP-N-acetylglucosamine diphosphorylase/glucosamine-1-phosphate N-acetyltransferase GlmU [Proteobacteria bacterium]|nr:bifunctional UDP-N-acetylglucosamine diphosphorylase/glucosamine-1-phosphate N-acetyltransferase GlmU [Pseudomonadota bacterium]
MMKLSIVILAAGQGKRMYSKTPKVLHKIGGKPILQHVIETAVKLNPNRLIIIGGHGYEEVKTTIDNTFTNNSFKWVFQDKQLGTGHALMQALPYLDNDGCTLVLYGDVPLINLTTLQQMIAKYEDNLVMLTSVLDNPSGYGRVVRDDKYKISKVVEEKDATLAEKLIREVNTGFYILANKFLPEWLSKISNNNQQSEYYLTDVIAFSYSHGVLVDYVESSNVFEALGINNKIQLEQLERVYQLYLADKLLESGATLADKSRVDIRGDVTVGQDCYIDVNCILEGNVVLGNNVVLGAGSILKNVIISDGVNIKPYSIIEDAVIGEHCQVGPFSRIRPGTRLNSNVHIGNFVEVKNSTIAHASKVNHLTYIGDAEIGSSVNIGAGSVTCNYDGKNKSKTVIGNGVFIGSGTMMVAPVHIKDGGVIGAGSTITKDTPENELTVARAKQVTVTGWVKRNKS